MNYHEYRHVPTYLILSICVLRTDSEWLCSSNLSKSSMKEKKLEINYEEVKIDESKSNQKGPFEKTAPLIATCLIKDGRNEKKSRIIKCSYCPAEFRLVKKYHEHLETNHAIKTNKRKRYSLGACSICGKLFKGRENLRIHLTTHNEENSFQCAVEDCAAAFKCSKFFLPFSL